MTRFLPILLLLSSACYEAPEIPSGEPTAPPPVSPPVAEPEICTDSGFVPLRRLNRTQYGRALNQLLGIDRQAAETLPDDDVGYGFDNVGEVLSVSPLHLEQFEAIAEAAVEEVLQAAPQLTRTTFVATELGSPVGGASAEYWNLWSNGEIIAEFTASHSGEYELGVSAWANQAGPDPARLSLRLDGRDLETFDVEDDNAPGTYYSVRVNVEAGYHTFAVAFINDYYRPDDPDPNERDRNLHVETLMVEGPFGVLLENPLRDRLLTC
ncbi:MAG: hypothetical protein CMH55_08970, partial [Myxococcales bacterium]|nr:hypothetical protein [Myxococcales bacterium]